MVTRTAVDLDFLEANEIVAALEQRVRTLRGHIENGVQDDILDAAIVRSLAAEERLRKAFAFQREPYLDGVFEGLMADLDDYADGITLADIPLALDTYWNRGA